MIFDKNNTHPKILCIDDEPINLEILEEALEDSYNLIMLQSAEECFHFITHSTPDLILLDVNMPGINGFDACIQLKSNPISKHIPIIFVTALGRESEKKQGFDVGGNDYISKPFEEDKLIETIQKWL